MLSSGQWARGNRRAARPGCEIVSHPASWPYLAEHILQLVDGRYDAFPQGPAGQEAQGRAPRCCLRLHRWRALAAEGALGGGLAAAPQPGSALRSC